MDSVNGDGEFTDILEDLRRSGDLRHALRTFKPPPPYRGAPPCSASDLSTTVAVETGSSVEAVEQQVGVLLREMSQNMQLSSIRLLGYTFSKTMRRLFTGVHVNMDALNKLQQASQEHPVILMPSHRSYLDFLIVSYLMFTYDLPIPVIAAGVPFYIRRAIGSDKLYWAVLSEYVKTIVRTGHAPLEFYVEGLRSRTLKALPPSSVSQDPLFFFSSPPYGMMHMVLEPFFKGEVYDITLVPISISYDRVVEESLLAHELLGVPKPKETTMGLLKASCVLRENYGRMHVTFGQSLSVRQQCEGRVDPSHYNLLPRDLPQKPSKDMQACVSWLAHRVVRTQEQGSVLSPWSLMACALLQGPMATLIREGLAWEALAQSTLWLRRQALGFGARLDWPVASHRNQALHVFVRPAMLAVAMHVTASRRRSELQAFFVFLLDVFSNEFVFTPGQSSQDFEEACSLLGNTGAIRSSQEDVSVTDEGQRTMSFLRTLLQPFMDSYQVVFSHLCAEEVHTFSDKQFVAAVRKLATGLILSGDLQTYEALSSDTQKNALGSLLRLEAVTKLRTDEQTEYSVKKSSVRRIGDMLCEESYCSMLEGHGCSITVEEGALGRRPVGISGEFVVWVYP
ncbi:hypothetical protein NHX12_026785, partial [Muraenolepis orangiensis]